MDNNINTLLNMWSKRVTEDYPEEYKDALRDCIYELKSVTDTVDNQDMEEYLNSQYMDYLKFLEADAYLSSIEGHAAV